MKPVARKSSLLSAAASQPIKENESAKITFARGSSGEVAGSFSCAVDDLSLGCRDGFRRSGGPNPDQPARRQSGRPFPRDADANGGAGREQRLQVPAKSNRSPGFRDCNFRRGDSALWLSNLGRRLAERAGLQHIL